jgi:hypothetical protein
VLLATGVPLVDSIFSGGFNTYTVDTIPGALYKISITSSTDDADLLFFGTDFSLSQLANCAIDNTALSDISAEDCVVAATGGKQYLAVDGYYLSASSATYTIAVEQLSIIEMNLSQPVLEATSRTSAAAYAVEVTSGNHYTVAITGLNDDADLYVFENSNLSNMATCTIDNRLYTETTPEDCTVSAGTGTLYFIIDGIFSSTQTILFTAFAAPAPAVAIPMNQGTPADPVELSIDTPAVGQVASAPTGTSYYAVTGLTASTYTVSVNGLTNDADLIVYNDGTFTTRASCSINNTEYLRTTAESCTVTASGDTLYFTVESFTTTGGVAFLSLIEPGP